MIDRPLRSHALVTAVATVVGLTLTPTSVRAQTLTDHESLAREIFRELIGINTTHSTGSTTDAAEAMAERLRAAGFEERDVRVLGPHPAKGNLVARIRGTGARPPMLLLAHLDVVEALPSDWSVDPFTLLERDGFFYGRGTSDDKAQAAIWVANLIRYRREGFTPDRDIIVALTADEEGGRFNGVRWLLEHHRDLIDAEFSLNEGGFGQMRDGQPILNQVQASEKKYLTFRLEVQNPGGHSSLPVRDNAIYHLAEGLARLADFAFPVQLNEITRAYFERMASLERGQVAADMRAVTGPTPDRASVERLAESPWYNALMRTTCVATRLEAGHADNALPQTARATVNCRILPDHSPDEVHEALVRVVDDPAITITTAGNATPSPASPLRPDVFGAIERITEAMWPGVAVVPTMVTGATDGASLRRAGIPTYGVTGLFLEMDDIRAHGRDERVGVDAFYAATEFLYRLVQALASGPTP